MRRALLVAGILSSVYCGAVNVYVPTRWAEYSVAAQTVSINIAAFMLWVVVFAVALLRRPPGDPTRNLNQGREP